MSNDYSVANEDIERLITRYKKADRLCKKLDKIKYKIQSEVSLHMGELETLITEDGIVLLTYKTGKDRDFFQAKKFQEAHPDLYKKFTIKKPGNKTFLVKD